MEIAVKDLLHLFMETTHRSRKRRSVAVTLLLGALAIIAVVPLFAILFFLISKGVKGISFEFFSSLPAAYGETGGGMGNALIGTLMIVGLASLAGIPLGIGTGIFLSESPVESRFAALVRGAAEMLAGVPSIVIGLFAYSVAVLPFGKFSALAGSVALSVIMLPTIARTSEEILRLVPAHVREAGLALGLPRWKVVLRIILRGSRKGLLTAVLLSVARASGETAPLLFTALNNRLWNFSPVEPMASLPVQIYTYATSPSEEWHEQAWSGALVLVLMVFGISLFARVVLSRKKHG
jgi:phosphate transport system permease protein